MQSYSFVGMKVLQKTIMGYYGDQAVMRIA